MYVQLEDTLIGLQCQTLVVLEEGPCTFLDHLIEEIQSRRLSPELQKYYSAQYLTSPMTKK